MEVCSGNFDTGDATKRLGPAQEAFPNRRPRPLIPSWNTAKNSLGQDFALVPPCVEWSRDGVWDKGAAPELGCREWGPACLSVPVKGGRLAPSLCRAPHPDGAGSAPFHSPQRAVGHGTRAPHPRAMIRVSPWPGSAPHGIWERDVTPSTASRDIPKGHQRHVTPSGRSRGSSPPHGSVGRSQETATQVHQQGPPHDNSPTSGSSNPNPLPIFPPNKPKPAALQNERDSSSRIWLPGSLLAAQSGFH